MEPVVEVIKQKRKYAKKEKALEETKQEPTVVKKEKKEKKKRMIDPNKMTYIKAFRIWCDQQNPKYQGLSPKKDSLEYQTIMKILNDHKSKVLPPQTETQ